MIQILLTLIVVGVILYLVNTVIPMVPWMRTVINCVAAIFVVIWLMQVFHLTSYRLPIR